MRLRVWEIVAVVAACAGEAAAFQDAQHENITQTAINNVGSAYPDLQKFGPVIVPWAWGIGLSVSSTTPLALSLYSSMGAQTARTQAPANATDAGPWSVVVGGDGGAYAVGPVFGGGALGTQLGGLDEAWVLFGTSFCNFEAC